MKKLVLLICVLPMLVGSGFAQQGARQDANVSVMGMIQPYVEGNGTPPVRQQSTIGVGTYIGYRYLLTPDGAVEGNYSYARFTNKLATSSAYARIRSSVQEATGAYVRSFVFKNFNPFLEAGGGLLFFSPLGGVRTTSYDTELEHSLTILVGGGVAYQLSPSWDLRVQYRAQIFKTPDFALKQFDTGRYYIVSQPAIGFAYHF